jgi:hypothetical protein
MTLRTGSKVDVVDFDLPDAVGASAASPGTNTVTATSWAVLPSNPVTVSITNPHPDADMLCLVTYGAWMSATASDVRLALDISGALSVPPGVGGGGAKGWGQVPMTSVSTAQQFSASFPVALPPGTTTFKAYAYRPAASGTQAVNYPVIDVTPQRYVL